MEKHTALKKQKELQSANIQQARISQQPNEPESLQNYKVVRNNFNSTRCLNQKYSFKKPSHLGNTDQKKVNGLHNQRQNFNSKYSLSKNKVVNKTSPVNKYVVNSKNLSNVSIVNKMSASNSKNISVKAPCISSNGTQKLPYNTKDFIKEIESITELLKKKASSSPRRILNPSLKCDNVLHTKQTIHKKSQNNASDSTKFIKKETTFLKSKDLDKRQSEMPANVTFANEGKRFINSNHENNLPQEKVFNVNKSVYKKNNVKQSLNANPVAFLRSFKNVDESKNRFKKNSSRSTSRKVIFSDSAKVSRDLYTSGRAGVFKIKPSPSSTQELIMKLHSPDKIISSAKKGLKKLPRISKMKSPVLLKIKSSNTVKVPKSIKLKQTNTRYRKINKHLTPPNKRIQLEHTAQPKSSLKKIKKGVNSKYKLINKTLTPNLNKKTANTFCTSVNKKNTSLTMDCDIYLEVLNDSAVEKLEQNLLAISSELTAPLSPEKNENCNSRIIQPFVPKINSKIDYKRTPFKKSKSRISKYKVINSNVSQKSSVKNVLFSPIITPLRREKAVLVRRLFKSKNVIINKNVSPTNYSAKMIKSKYLSFNKRKSSNCQKYMHPAVSQHLKFKGNFFL